MKIGSIGYDHSHDERFVMDFEDGLECWLFLIIKTTAKFVIGKEKMQAEPGTILLLEPGTPCRDGRDRQSISAGKKDPNQYVVTSRTDSRTFFFDASHELRTLFGWNLPGRN